MPLSAHLHLLPPSPSPCSWGLILYRTHLKPGALDQEGKLDLGGRPGDYASVFIAGGCQ